MRFTDRSDAPGRVWHVTARINWQRWHLDDEAAFETFIASLDAAAKQFSMELLAYIVMSNHYHAVARSPKGRRYRELTGRYTPCRHLRPYPRNSPRSTAVGQFVRAFHLATANSLQARLGVKGHLWEKRHHRRCIGDPRDLVFTIAYDHRNPTKEGMVARPEDSTRSSAAWWAGEGPSSIDLLPSGVLPFGLDLEQFRSVLLEYQRSKALAEIERALEESGFARGSENFQMLVNRLVTEHGLPFPIAASGSAMERHKSTI